ncbi:E3 ubiquitin-protein ligase Topors-like [Metopolophium dirhodum]|uniref:E3 ubiquitin-protein ligase Topors-like n=1 Tax=Metopolophium dirhodum TaxID=44670 RepID=UPI00298FA939|nr:E3 ubiquitin-protein ligase Topors-like [Metopolophium dirhodum]
MGGHEVYDVSIISSDESSSDDDSDENYETRLSPALEDSIPYPPIFGEARRMQIYSNNLWASPLQDTIGRIRECSLNFYRNNPLQLHRLHLFILRDISAIRKCLRLENRARLILGETNMTVASSVMESLLNCEIRQLHMLFRLRHFLDVYTRHFCHELYNFASSPFDIMEYDRNVLYTYRPSYSESTEPLSIETIVLNSDDEEVQRPMITTNVSSITNDSDNVIHSCFNPASIDQPSTSTGIRDSLNQPNNSNNDSDVVIIKHIIRPIKPLNSAAVDQPSTSTGIRDSLNQPNNRRKKRNLCSSSDDEDSIVVTRGSKTAYIKSRNINNNKNKKKKINTKISSNNRNRSSSESSSTSGETDTN